LRKEVLEVCDVFDVCEVEDIGRAWKYSTREKMFNMFMMFERFLRLGILVGVENIQPVRRGSICF
jgi:hypothetical protein